MGIAEPEEFGDYLLLKKIATGGMGEVFLARQEQGWGFQRHVVIKRILPELCDDDEFVRMFLDEARLAAKLDHPNVAQIHDLGLCGNQYYIAMEFLEGRDLRRIMGRLASRRRIVPGAYAVQIIHSAAEGLHYAHKLKDPYGQPLNIIHRDVSPQNVFVTSHGTVKVLDFGIAKAEVRSIRTRTGGLKGKYPYLSPEQVRGEPIDQRSDVFALGTVLWELTVGRRLFKRPNDLLTLQAVLRCEIPPPSMLIENYPTELEAIVLRALAGDLNRRYPDCKAFQEDLAQFAAGHGLVLSPHRLGEFVQQAFYNEPMTLEGILDQLSQKPTSQSLLRDRDRVGAGERSNRRSSSPSSEGGRRSSQSGQSSRSVRRSSSPSSEGGRRSSQPGQLLGPFSWEDDASGQGLPGSGDVPGVAPSKGSPAFLAEGGIDAQTSEEEPLFPIPTQPDERVLTGEVAFTDRVGQDGVLLAPSSSDLLAPSVLASTDTLSLTDSPPPAWEAGPVGEGFVTETDEASDGGFPGDALGFPGSKKAIAPPIVSIPGELEAPATIPTAAPLDGAVMFPDSMVGGASGDAGEVAPLENQASPGQSSTGFLGASGTEPVQDPSHQSVGNVARAGGVEAISRPSPLSLRADALRRRVVVLLVTVRDHTAPVVRDLSAALKEVSGRALIEAKGLWARIPLVGRRGMIAAVIGVFLGLLIIPLAFRGQEGSPSPRPQKEVPSSPAVQPGRVHAQPLSPAHDGGVEAGAEESLSPNSSSTANSSQ